MIDNDALIREIEEQRNFMASRAARLAGIYAAHQSELIKTQAELKAANETIAAAEKAVSEAEQADRHKAE